MNPVLSLPIFSTVISTLNCGLKFPYLPVLLFISACLLSLSAMPAKAADSTPVWSSGSTAIYAIQDRPGEMPLSLFSGPASEQERQKYFTNGVAPASINAFLVTINGKNFLVDTGFGTVAPGKSNLLPRLQEMGISPDDINAVLLTHMHMDHAGGLLSHKQRVFPKAKIMVSKPELEYWLGLAQKEPGNANAALVKTITEVYGTDISTPFVFGDSVLEGVTALDAVGHTPGHTAFQFGVEGKKLLIVGDLVHAAALQFPLPQECASYDMDKSEAVQSRVKILEMAAENNIPVLGMHIPLPGYGSVAKNGNGFTFTPIK